MTDWGIDPGAWEQYAKGTAAILDVLNKLRETWSRRKKATRPEDTRALDKELDALQADFQKMVGAMMQHLSSHTRFLQAVVNLLGPMDTPEGDRPVARLLQHFPLIRATADATKQLQEVVLAHGDRLKALEHPPEDRGTRVTKQKRRRVSKQKRRR